MSTVFGRDWAGRMEGSVESVTAMVTLFQMTLADLLLRIASKEREIFGLCQIHLCGSRNQDGKGR